MQATPRNRPVPDVPGEPLSGEAGSAYWTHRLRARGGERLAMVPSVAVRSLFLMMLAIGVLAAVVPFLDRGVGLVVRGIGVAVGATFLAYGLMGLFGMSHCTMDRGRGVLTLSRGFNLPAGDIPLADVLAVQVAVCPAAVPAAVEGKPEAKVYELNLVLADARRLTLARHSLDKWIPAAARQIADFLAVPLLGEPAAAQVAPDAKEKGDT